MFWVISQPNIDGFCFNMDDLKATMYPIVEANFQNVYPIHIKIQNGSYLLVRGDTPGDTSQPWISRYL